MYYEFEATGVSPWFKVPLNFNVDLYGDGVGTVSLEKTYNGGTDVIAVKTLEKGDPQFGNEKERTSLYRFNCSAYSSGTLKCRAK